MIFPTVDDDRDFHHDHNMGSLLPKQFSDLVAEMASNPEATTILAMASFCGTTSFRTLYTCVDEPGDDVDNPGPGFPLNSPFTMMYFLLPLWFCNVSLRPIFQPLSLHWNVTTGMAPYLQICARHDEPSDLLRVMSIPTTAVMAHDSAFHRTASRLLRFPSDSVEIAPLSIGQRRDCSAFHRTASSVLAIGSASTPTAVMTHDFAFHWTASSALVTGSASTNTAAIQLLML